MVVASARRGRRGLVASAAAALAAVVLVAAAASVGGALAAGEAREGQILNHLMNSVVNKAQDNLDQNLFGTDNSIPPPVVPGQTDPKGAAQRVLKTDERCVVCQYVVQRIRAELLMNGALGGVPFSEPPAGPRGSQAYSSDPFQQQYTPPPASPEQKAAGGDPNSGAGSGGGGGGGGGVAGSDMLVALLETEAEAGTSRRGGPLDTLKNLANIGQGQMGAAAVANRPKGSFWKTPRERRAGLITFRPTQQRYADVYDGPQRASERAQRRFESNQMFSVVFRTMEDLCSRRMPEPYYGYCAVLLKNYEAIATGLRWNDRPDSICMGMSFCDATSYIQQGPHAVYRPNA